MGGPQYGGGGGGVSSRILGTRSRILGTRLPGWILGTRVFRAVRPGIFFELIGAFSLMRESFPGCGRS